MDREVNERSLLASYVDQVEAGIHAREMRASIRAELEDHLYNQVEEQMDKGMSRSDAEANAVRQMGSIETLAEKFNMVHRTRVPWLFWGMIAILLLVTMLAVWTIPHVVQGPFFGNGGGALAKQCIYIMMGLAIFVIVVKIDYRWWRNKGWYFYLSAMLLLLLSHLSEPQLPGAWLSIRVANLFLDVVFISTFFFLFGLFLIIAQYRAKQRILRLRLQMFFQLIGLIPAVLFIIELQLDATVIYLIGLIMILWIQVFSLKSLLIGSAVATITGLISFFTLKTYRFEWFESWTNHLMEYYSGYLEWLSQYWGIIAESSWWGVGWIEPVDMILAHSNLVLVIVAAYGWVGGGVVLAILFGWLCWMFYASTQVKQHFGQGMMLFISSYFAIPIVMNIGALLGILPNMGTFPLLDYGFNGLPIWMFAIGLCTNIYMRKDTLPKHEAKWDRTVVIGKGR